MWMNQYEIEAAAQARHACPNVRKGVRLLAALLEAVNSQSDGWAYWPAPSKAAEKLMNLLHTSGNLAYGTGRKISDAELKAAISPIRAMVTKQRKLQAKHGNKFEFDVDAAMAEPKPLNINTPGDTQKHLADSFGGSDMGEPTFTEAPLKVLKKRKLLDGSEVDHYNREIPLTIKSRCPAKWAFIDMEKGDIWVSGHRNPKVTAKEPGYQFYRADKAALQMILNAASTVK